MKVYVHGRLSQIAERITKISKELKAISTSFDCYDYDELSGYSMGCVFEAIDKLDFAALAVYAASDPDN